MESYQQSIVRIRSDSRTEIWGRVARRLMILANDRAARQFDQDREFYSGHTTASSMSKVVIAPIPSSNMGNPSAESGTSSENQFSRPGTQGSLRPPSQNSQRASSSQRPTSSAQSETMESGNNLSLKESLQGYVFEEPSWKIDAKQVMRKFGRLLRKQFPNIIDNLHSIHNRPFAAYSGSIRYESSNNYSFIEAQPTTKKKPMLRSSWSCIDLQTFRNKKGVNLEDPSNDQEEPQRHVRSNSFNARFDLRDSRPRKRIGKMKDRPESVASGSEGEYTSEDDQDSESASEDFDFEEVRPGSPNQLVPFEQRPSQPSQYYSQILWCGPAKMVRGGK